MRWQKQKPSVSTTQKALVCIIALAPSNFCMGQPPDYRSRSSVSQLSSGWYQSGSTAPLAPGKLGDFGFAIDF
jgi:hypothetical protein